MARLLPEQQQMIREAIVQRLAQFFTPAYSPAGMADLIMRDIETTLEEKDG